MSTDTIQNGPEGADDGYDAPIRPADAELGTEPTEAEKAAAWLPDADEATVSYLSSRGWDKDPAGLVKSQRESEAALRREQEARAAMEEQLADAYLRLQSGEQQPQQQSDDPFGLTAAAQAYENGEITAVQWSQYQNQVTLQAAQQIAEGIVAQRMEPVETYQTTRTMQDTADRLAETYPDFADLSGDVLALIERNPDQYGTAEGMRSAYGLVRAERDAQASRERTRASSVETLDNGSRGQAGVDAQEAIRKQLRELGAPRDGL